MLLIVGLGNPGKEYESTRHNVGFMLVDRVSRAYGIRLDNKTPEAFWGKGRIEGEEVFLAKPRTYMNLSGPAVSALIRGLSLPPASIIVAHDDCDLPLGRLRIRRGGGSGGHRGVTSIMAVIGTSDFPRVRLGIGRPVEGDLRDYVLAPFAGAELKDVEDMLDRGTASIEVIIREGIEAAMNRFNPS